MPRDIVLRIRESYSKQVYALRAVGCAERLLSARCAGNCNATCSLLLHASPSFARTNAFGILTPTRTHAFGGRRRRRCHACARSCLRYSLSWRENHPCTYHQNQNNKNNNNKLLLLLLFSNVDNHTGLNIKTAQRVNIRIAKIIIINYYCYCYSQMSTTTSEIH